MSKFTKKSGIGGLVFSRRVGEHVTINGGEIVIEVVQIKSNLVRLAFKASKDISIVRSEIAKDENHQADEE